MEPVILLLSGFAFLLMPTCYAWSGKDAGVGIFHGVLAAICILLFIVFQTPDPMKTLREEVFLSKYLLEIPAVVIGGYLALRFDY